VNVNTTTEGFVNGRRDDKEGGSMLKQRSVLSAMIGLLVTTSVLVVLALAQTGKSGIEEKFPERAIRIVVPSTPGGALDFLSRIIGPGLTKAWGQPVMADNRPGAGGIIGSEFVVNSPPDGHTLLVVAGGFTVNPYIYTKLPYDTVKDFAPVTLLASSTHVLVVHPKLQVQTIRELIALARAKPGQLTYATSGIGTGGYLCSELMKKMAGIDMLGVSYKGAGASTTAVLGGEIDMLFTQIAPVVHHIKAGKLRPFATTSLKRSPQLPDVPTLSESGLPGFQVDAWCGMLAPAGTPGGIVLKLQKEISKVLHSTDVREKLTAAGFEPVGDSPDTFAALIRLELGKWSKLMQDAGIKPEAFR
jgi:tripartite-type tricarboxylate transporter receptor subunit TctC